MERNSVGGAEEMASRRSSKDSNIRYGRPNRKRVFKALGAALALETFVSTVVWGWRYGGLSGPAMVGGAVAGALLIVGWALRDGFLQANPGSTNRDICP